MCRGIYWGCPEDNDQLLTHHVLVDIGSKIWTESYDGASLGWGVVDAAIDTSLPMHAVSCSSVMLEDLEVSQGKGNSSIYQHLRSMNMSVSHSASDQWVC